jgi:uncharacterized protein (DUF1330 family)
MPANELTLVVLLELDSDRMDDYERFETEAARVMGQYGGRIERRVALTDGASGGDRAPNEVHLVTFPTEERFRAYTQDPRLQELAGLRARAIRHTEIWHGRDLAPFSPPRETRDE